MANAGSNSVSVIDTSTNIVITTVAVGAIPLNVALTPDGGARLRGQCGHALDHSDQHGEQRGRDHPRVGSTPAKIAITPNGAQAYVADAGAKSVSVIDTTTGPPKVIATVGVGANPVDVSITRDGTRAYVTNAGSNSVSVIDTTTGPPKVIGTVGVGANPVNAAIF